MPVELNCVSQGSQLDNNPPLVILHGLFGSTDNWASRARQYAIRNRVYSMDLRNHGDSPHHDEMDYPSMAADVSYTLDTLGLDSYQLLGHSMGGKVAMQLACNRQTRISKLVVVDIAPKPYPDSHTQIINAMLDIDTSRLKSRAVADETLAVVEEDPAVRAFLLKSLQRDGDGFRWQLNISSIAKSYPKLLEAPVLDHPYGAPALFIKGAESNYLQSSDAEVVQRWFPNASVKVIDGAGHWPHASKPEVFDHVLTRFLE